MKKFLLLCGLFAMTMFTFAQVTKKVAILEVVDREGKLSYSQKMVLRSNMAQAISGTQGFEAYDRSDIDAIMSEQDFQRTGLVNENEIRKLGEMTGVSLILVTEAVILDDNKLFVSAKILNVETSKVDISNNVVMGSNIEAIQQGCTELTKKMFGISTVSAQTTKYYINFLGGGQYEYNGNVMDKKAYALFLYKNCPEAYKKCLSGKKIATSGWVCLGTGLGFIAIGTGLTLGVDNMIGISVFSSGVILSGTGVILLPIGYIRQRNAYDVYNKKCALTSTTPIMFNITTGQNGIGMAMNF